MIRGFSVLAIWLAHDESHVIELVFKQDLGSDIDVVVPDITLRHNSLRPVSEDLFEKFFTRMPIQ